MKLSKGNRKMKLGFLIFNLPARETCPGSTPLCRSICYARKAEVMYKYTLPCRHENLATFDREGMIKLIGRTAREYKAFNNFFRIHESGDFHCQEYLDDWKKIASTFPHINFLAFTKSFMLDFSDLPPNLQMVASIMTDTELTPPPGMRRSFAGDCKDMPTERVLHCPGVCDSCGMCWQLDKIGFDTHFNIH